MKYRYFLSVLELIVWVFFFFLTTLLFLTLCVSPLVSAPGCRPQQQLQRGGLDLAGSVSLGLEHLPAGLRGRPAAPLLLLLPDPGCSKQPGSHCGAQGPCCLLLQAGQWPRPLHPLLTIPQVAASQRGRGSSTSEVFSS